MATAKKNNSAYTAAPAADKEKALATAIAQIERAYGKGSIMRMSDRPNMQVDAVPTGSLSLDLALGIGGIITPQTSSLLHNASTIALSMHSSRAYNL